MPVKAQKFFNKVLKEDFMTCYMDLFYVEEIDMSFLALLISFKKTLVSMNKFLLINTLPDEHPIYVTLKKLGLSFDDYNGANYGI